MLFDFVIDMSGCNEPMIKHDDDDGDDDDGLNHASTIFIVTSDEKMPGFCFSRGYCCGSSAPCSIAVLFNFEKPGYNWDLSEPT